MADVIFWLGDASTNTATIVVRSDTAGSVTVSGVTASPVSVNPATEYGIGKLSVTGLAADTAYPFVLYLDAVEVARGTLRTLPASGSFNIGWGSCVGQSALHAWGFQAVLDHSIRAFFALGDTPYCDEAVSSVTVDGLAQRRWSLGAAVPGPYGEWSTAGRAAYDKSYDNFQRIPGWAYVTERVPTYRMADDHEYADDWDWTWTNTKNNVTGKGFVLGGDPLLSQANADTCGAAANAAYNSWAKGNPAPDAGVLGWKPSACADTVAEHPPQFYRKTIANTEFFCILGFPHRDPWTKYDKPFTVCVDRAENTAMGYTYSDPSGAALAKTMLGPHQLNWLLDKLAASTATFKVIMSPPMPVMMNAIITGGLGPNNAWEQWQTEVDYIKAWIKQSGVKGVIWLTGDAHIPSVVNDKPADFCCANSAPLSQISYIGSSGTRFYQPGYANGCIWRGEPIDGSTVPGAKKNAYGILTVTAEYLKPQIYDENGTLLWEGYLLAGENTLKMSLDEASGEWA